jgi:hypothetical protein
MYAHESATGEVGRTDWSDRNSLNLPRCGIMLWLYLRATNGISRSSVAHDRVFALLPLSIRWGKYVVLTQWSP